MYKARRLFSPSPVDKPPSRNTDEPWDDLQKSGAETEVVQMLADIQILEKRQEQSSRFRQLCCRLEPLVKFLVMYSPAVDIMIVQNSIRIYHFVTPAILRMADIFSISSRLYQAIKIVMKSFLRSVDVEFEDGLQSINRRYLSFQEEVTLAHRQNLENHMVQQKTADIALRGALCNSERNMVDESGNPSKSVNSVLAWLEWFDFQEPLRRTNATRASGTGAWLVETPEFRHWLRNNEQDYLSRVLWIHGAPGVGKSVLCGTVIEHLQKKQVKNEAKVSTIAYFYCDSSFATKRTPFDICKALILQVQSQCQEPLSALQAAYRNAALHGRSHISDADDVFSLFCRVAADLESSYVIVDGLDECTDIPTVIKWLLDATSSMYSLRLIIFSRDTLEVRKGMAGSPSLDLTADSMKPDIEIYLSKSVLSLPCDTWQMKEHVLNVISRKADGMFLFAVLSLHTLQQANNIDDTLEMVESTPNGVYNMYRMILDRLSTGSGRRQSLAHKALGLISTSTRPLTWPELRAALSWDTNQQDFRPTSAPFKDAILAILCPLIEYREETDTFRLVHLSLYEYLFNETKQHHTHQDVPHFLVDPNDAHGGVLADMTLAQIANDYISRSISVDSDQYPFATYATKNWCHHLSLSPYDPKRFRKYLDFIANADRRSTWILRWLLSEDTSFPLQQIVRLQRLVQDWLEKGSSTTDSVDSLCDIQRALFRLDGLPQPMPGLRMISNFERLVCVRGLAREFTSAGKLDEGVRMFEDALYRAGAEDGGIEISSCWLLNSLGILYDQQGNATLAKETQQRALVCQNQRLPPGHLDIVLTLNELGRLARHLGHYEEAESLHRKALSILESLFEETDLHITWTKSALGRSLLKQGRPSEALSLHQHVLSVEVERLGKDHPHTLWTMSDIVRCFRDLSRLDCAITMQQEIVDRSGSVLGPKNPDTLWAMNSLGLLFETAGNRTIAMNVQKTAYTDQTEIFGEDLPHCVWTRDVLQKLQGRQS
ncbi:MAG: hypothetical protein LQ338_003288 [Usnochroma carphineum]|nr:MAG: hypothetical protein LQ338_003288 [Usnochroma carphineum]